MRTRRRSRHLLLAVVALWALLAGACGGYDADKGATATTGVAASATTAAFPSGTAAFTVTAVPPKATGPVTVFAATSLREAFKEMAAQFEATNPGAEVTFNFAASSALVQQIIEGAPVDVFASADEANMKKLTEAGGNGDSPEVFAQNALEIIVPPGNPQGIAGLADLARPDVLFVSCAPEVPIGKYSAEALAKAGAVATPVSYEENVKAVVTKVTSGEADAGIVYATDVKAAGASGVGVKIPTAQNVIATYPIATTRAAPNARAGAAFVDFVASAAGGRTLEKYGFVQP